MDKKMSMNEGYVLIKEDNSIKQIDGLQMVDGSGNAIKGVIIRSYNNFIFPEGHLAYFASGTKVGVDGKSFYVVKKTDIFFTIEK